MDTLAKKGIISRKPGRSDAKWVFSELWQNSLSVTELLETLKRGDTTPEDVTELLFGGGSEDCILWCFLILVSKNHKETLTVIEDLSNHAFDGVDDAHDWFFTHIYAKEKICSGRHDCGRKRSSVTA